jgi:hypothetical protein
VIRRARAWAAWLAWSAAAALASVAAGCGGNACPKPGAGTATAPAIDDVRMLRHAVPGDPWELVFIVGFRDGDGDLGGGVADVYLNEKTTPTALELLDLFRASAVALDSTGGALTIPLRFSDNVGNGDKVRLGLQLVDEAGQRSNCYALDLDFEVIQLLLRLAGRSPSPL